MNLLGIDFEDWYHPELVQNYIQNEKHEPKMFPKRADFVWDYLKCSDVSTSKK